MQRVIDLGGDTDTVAVFGIAGIPMRRTSVVHGRVPGGGDRRWDLADLHVLARAPTGS